MSNTYIEKIENCLDRALRDSNDQEIVVTEIGIIEKYLPSLKAQMARLERGLTRCEEIRSSLTKESELRRARIRSLEVDYTRAKGERNAALAKIRDLEEDLARIKKVLTQDQQTQVLPEEEWEIPFG